MVEEHCWSATWGSYVWYPGTEELDTSILLHAGSGFDVGARMSATIDALRAELGAGPLLYRYSGAGKDEARSSRRHSGRCRRSTRSAGRARRGR